MNKPPLHTSAYQCLTKCLWIADLTPKPRQPNAEVLDQVPLSTVRLAVLNLSGQPITQLSTSRIFAFLTHCGAAPLGLEWIDDQSCNVVFKDHHASRTALEYLRAPTGKRKTAEQRAQEAEKRRKKAAAAAFTFGGEAADVDAEPQADEGELDMDDDEEDGEMDTDAEDPDPLPDLEDMGKVNEQQTTFDEDADIDLGIALLTCRRTRPVPITLFTPAEREAAAKLIRRRKQQAEEAAQRKAEGGETAPAADEDSVRRPEEEDERPEIYREMEEEERQRKKMKRDKDPAIYAIRRLTSTLYARFAIQDHDVKAKRAGGKSEWYRKHGRDAGREVVPKLLQVGGFKDPGELLPDEEDYQSTTLGARLVEPSRGSTAKLRANLLDRELDDYRRGWDNEGRDRNRERSASPLREDGRPKTPPGGPSGIRIRGRGAVRAPRKSVWDDEEDALDESQREAAGGYLVSDQIEEARYKRRADRGYEQPQEPAEADRWTTVADRTLLERLNSEPEAKLLDRISSGRSLSSRLG